MGQFRIGNLPPGEYRIAAWEKNEPGITGLPDFHAIFDAHAGVVRLAEDLHETVQPPLIGRDMIEAAAAKLP